MTARNFFAAAFIAATTAAVPAQAQTGHNFETAKNLEIFNNLFKQLDLYYVDTIKPGKLMLEATDAMLSTLDPYTDYFTDSERGDLKQMLTGKYGGIGALIHYSKDEKRCLVAEPFEGSPAAEAGLRAGDVIISIGGKEFGPLSDGKPVDEFTTSVSSALRGEPGTQFALVVKRPGQEQPITFNITRRAIKTPAVTYYGITSPGVGYIYLSTFTGSPADEMRRAVADLKGQGAKKLVVDLRGNGGGSLEEAVEIINLFIGKGKKVVELKGKVKSEQQTYSTSHDPLDAEMPLAVLVNGSSASASEIMAGTLQDYDRAVIIGSRTYGKGLVQQTRPLPYGGVLKLTTSKYYIPSGRCIQAIDYSHRNADGSVGRIPDSLTSVFHTAGGRPVRDGGGILPDSVVKIDSVANIVVYLSPSMQTSQVLFDFVTDYVTRHPSVAKPEDFDISDDEFERFKQYAKEHKFTYDKQSEKVLGQLKKVAAFEGYDVSAELKALEAKLAHNEDYDFDHWKPEIKRLLNAEIMLRYYYRSGSVRNSLRSDKVYDVALAVLADPALYHKMLTAAPGEKGGGKTAAKAKANKKKKK